jgi:hypothetical protein
MSSGCGQPMRTKWTPAWLTANRRYLRSIGTSPDQRWDADRAAMVGLPPVAPAVGLTGRVRLARDYYVGRVTRTVVRHEALVVRMEVGVLRRLAVVAAGCSWRQPDPRDGGEGGSSRDEVGSVQYCRMGRAR